MRAYAHILYPLARFIAGVPPETLGAAILFALGHSWLVAVFCSVVLFILKYLVGLLIGGFVAWYLGKMFVIHIWPRCPLVLQQLIQRIEDRILFRPLDKDRGSAHESKASCSRNSKRYPTGDTTVLFTQVRGR